MSQTSIRRAIHDILTKARELRENFGHEADARCLEWAADLVEQALGQDADQLLTLEEASRVSGYHAETLARKVRTGQIPDPRPDGSKGRLLIRKSDLPMKREGRHIRPTDDANSPAASVRGRRLE